eukprot:351641-Chlamydomonas_euryale.AAC.3
MDTCEWTDDPTNRFGLDTHMQARATAPVRVTARVTGSGRTRSMPVLSAARQRRIGHALGVHTLGVRARVTGSVPTRGMPVLSAARQRGSSSGVGAVTKGTPLRVVLSHPIPALPCPPGREDWPQSCKSPVMPRVALSDDHSTAGDRSRQQGFGEHDYGAKASRAREHHRGGDQAGAAPTSMHGSGGQGRGAGSTPPPPTTSLSLHLTCLRFMISGARAHASSYPAHDPW